MKRVPTLCQFTAITIANGFNCAIHTEKIQIKNELCHQLFVLPQEMVLLVYSYLSPLSMLYMEEDLVRAQIEIDTSGIWKKFCKKWDAANDKRRPITRRKSKTDVKWKNRFWERVLRSCFNELNLVRSRLFANAVPSVETTDTNTNPNNPEADNNTKTSVNSSNTNTSNSNTPSTNDDISLWVLSKSCVKDMLRPQLPRGVVFRRYWEITTRIWLFGEFVDLCAAFINEIRLFNIIITAHNLPYILHKFKNLRALTMSYTRSQLVWAPIVSILKSVPHIQELNLEYVFLDDLCPIWDTLIELGTPLTSLFINTGNLTGCKQLSKLISSLQLKELTLWDINFEPDSEDAFFKSLSGNTSLEWLDIQEINLSGDLGAIPHISNLITLPQSQLMHLDLTECFLESEDMYGICKALEQSSTIQNLNFSSNFMEIAGATALANFFSINATITNLVISDCKLAPLGFEKLITSITNSKAAEKIQVLDLSYNFGGLLTEGWAHLLNSCTGLRKLNLESTQLGTTVLREDFQESLRYHPSLTNINLSANRLCDIGVVTLLPTLVANYNLQTINLSGNLVTQAGGDAIAGAFLNREIRSLDLQRNKLGTATQRIKQLPGISKLMIGHTGGEMAIVDGVQEV